jgi:hypothetical protein
MKFVLRTKFVDQGKFKSAAKRPVVSSKALSRQAVFLSVVRFTLRGCSRYKNVFIVLTRENSDRSRPSPPLPTTPLPSS